jgi:hypothetical protein
MKCVISLRQNAGQNCNKKIAEEYFVNVTMLKYFEKTLTEENNIDKELEMHT